MCAFTSFFRLKFGWLSLKILTDRQFKDICSCFVLWRRITIFDGDYLFKYPSFDTHVGIFYKNKEEDVSIVV